MNLPRVSVRLRPPPQHASEAEHENFSKYRRDDIPILSMSGGEGDDHRPMSIGQFHSGRVGVWWVSTLASFRSTG